MAKQGKKPVLKYSADASVELEIQISDPDYEIDGLARISNTGGRGSRERKTRTAGGSWSIAGRPDRRSVADRQDSDHRGQADQRERFVIKGDNVCRVHFLNVKNGSCSLIQHTNGHVLMFDVNCARP